MARARAAAEPPGSGGSTYRGKTVWATYICPGLDGADGGEEAGHVFRARIRYGDELEHEPLSELRCKKCGRTDGFEVRTDVIT